MKKVKFDPLASETLNKLIPILYNNGYFATGEYAKLYVDAIITFFLSISTRVSHTALNTKYGLHYCQYKPNRRTTWYILFDKEEEIYVIRNIINNHSLEYTEVIAIRK